MWVEMGEGGNGGRGRGKGIWLSVLGCLIFFMQLAAFTRPCKDPLKKEVFFLNSKHGGL